MGVTTVLARGAKTDPRGWALVVEAGQGFEGVVGDGFGAPWEVGRGHPVLTSVKVPRELESMGMKVMGLLVKVWKCR